MCEAVSTPACRAEFGPFLAETGFLDTWDDDIKRAARAASDGYPADEEDLAQVARARLILVYRAFPDAPTGYLRAVVGNAIRSATRRRSRMFSSHSRLVEPLRDDVVQAVSAPIPERDMSVRTWVSQLPTRLRIIYQHIYSEGRSQREAARLMKVSQPRVAQLHRELLARGREDLASLAA